MPTVVITGASGLLGRAIVTAFAHSDWNVIGFAFSRSGANLVKLDLCDHVAVDGAIDAANPQLIIHAAAQRFPDKVDTQYDASFNLNVQSTKNLALIAAERKIPLLYISTDYVFDGECPPYKADDPPKPINKYGLLKLEGEKVTLDASPLHIVLRIPVLYGNVEYLEESAVTVLLKQILDTTKQIEASNYEIRNPSHVSDIANICRQIADRSRLDSTICGIYQWCGKECLTKYQMVQVISGELGLSYSHITPNNKKPPTGGSSSRPHDVRMDTTKLESLGIGAHTPFKEGIKQSLTPQWTHTHTILTDPS